MYAFVAETDVQRAALRKKGAVWSPSLERWMVRDLSSWALRGLKRKGLVPQVAPAPVPTATPSLRWPKWINWVSFAPPVVLFILLVILFGKPPDFGSFAIVLFVSIFWIAFSTIISKLLYAFYRRLRGDRRYWEDMNSRNGIRSSSLSRHSNDDICGKFIYNPIYSGLSGNIYYRDQDY